MQLFINITSSETAYRAMQRSRWALVLIFLYAIVAILSPSKPLPAVLSAEHQHLIQTATLAAKLGILAWVIWCDFRFRRQQYGQVPWLFAFAVFELIGRVSLPLTPLNLLGIFVLIPSNVILFNMVQAWRFLRKNKKDL